MQQVMYEEILELALAVFASSTMPATWYIEQVEGLICLNKPVCDLEGRALKGP